MSELETRMEIGTVIAVGTTRTTRTHCYTLNFTIV